MRQWRTKEPGMLESMGLQRVGHDLATEQKPKSKKGWVRRERKKKKKLWCHVPLISVLSWLTEIPPVRIHRSKSLGLVRTLLSSTCARRRQVLETQDTTEAISAC